MAVIPGKKNFTVQRRADFPLRLTFKDSTGSAINLTGFTVAAQVYDDSRTTKYADFTVAYTNRTGGIVEFGALNETKNEMKKVLEEIQSGAFAKEWMSQAREGAPFLNQKREEASAHQIEAIGKDLRNMMPFLDAKDIKKDK